MTNREKLLAEARELLKRLSPEDLGKVVLRLRGILEDNKAT